MSQPSETTHVPAVPDLVAEAGASGDGRTGTLIEALHEGVVIQDVGGRIVAANSRAEEVLGLTRSQLTGLTSLDPRWRAIKPDGTPSAGTDHPASRVLATGVAQVGELMGVRSASGGLRWLRVNATPLRDADGMLTGVAVTFVDVTTQRAEREELRRAKDLFSTAFADAPIGMALVGLDGSWLKINRQLCALLGYSEEELHGRTFQEVTHPEDLEGDLALMQETLAGKRRGYELPKRYIRSDGRVIDTVLSVSLASDGEGRPLHFISHVQDVTKQRRLEAQLKDLAEHDSLTGLLNRRRFEEELRQQLARCTRYGDRAALVMMDLDGFKEVNDTLGHAAGDDVLRGAGERLNARVRAGDTIARIGGDEFAAILVGVDEARAHVIAEELTAAAGDETTGVTASAGSWPLTSGLSADEALAHADRAMYAAKRLRAVG